MPDGEKNRPASYFAGPGEVKKCVLLYSGGLDTSCMLKWIQDHYHCEVISLIIDVGQPEEDWNKIAEKAEKLGVVKHIKIDAKDEFVSKFVFPAIKANALYEGTYPLHSALSRPLLSYYAVKVAHEEGADAIAHGCTGKGNDQVRINITALAYDPEIKILQPIVEWGMLRDQEIEYAKKHGIPVPIGKENPYSIDDNVWGRSIECGILEHPNEEPPEDAYEWTTQPEKAPDNPEYVEIEFKEGIPIAINGEEMKGLELIKLLNTIGGKHGIGRLDHMEDRIVGIKSREIYESPAAVILISSHQDLEKFVLTRDEVLFKPMLDQKWTYLIYAGLWADPLRDDLEAFINKSNERVTGKVRMKLYKGKASVVGRESEYGLYDYNLATYEKASSFNERTSYGFIELWGMQSKIARIIGRKKESI